MEKSREVTIYDIAKNLKVSPSTVSRALNDDPTVSKKTRKKVSEKAAQLGYQSNQFAKSLRQRQSFTIGVIVYELNSSFVTSVLSGIEKVAHEAGYGIIITDSSQSGEKEIANAQSLFKRRVDGVIALVAPDTKQFDHFTSFIDKNIPVIFLDRDAHLPKSASVVIDNARSGYIATRHLIDQGCRRIAHITSSTRHAIFAQRYNGYRAALREADLPFDESLLIVTPLTEEASCVAAETLMRLQADGAFVTSDLAAAVCIRTLLDHGFDVPGDIAIVGFNNDVIGKLIRPTLTTVNYPGLEMGETAGSALVKRLKGISNFDQISAMTLRAELIIRQSSLKKDSRAAK